MRPLVASDFSLAACQAVVFTPDQDVPLAKASRELVTAWSDTFDEPPTMLPQVEGMPADLPRLILQGGGKQWRFEVAPRRAAVHWQLAVPSAQASISPKDFFSKGQVLLKDYQSRFEPRIGRLAAVMTRMAPHTSPGLFLASHFCKDRWLSTPLNRPESFELHAHKRFSMGSFVVNSWVRVKTALLVEALEKKTLVIVEQDINTMAEEEGVRSFQLSEVERFFSAVAKESDDILNLYFPPPVS